MSAEVSVPRATVTFIGTGDAFGSGGRLQTCILVDGPGIRFAIDFGASSLIGLRRQGVDPNSIDAILITHMHGDHCAGIPFFMLDAMLDAKRSAPLTIFGPSGLQAHLRRLQSALEPGCSVEEAGLRVGAVRARHAPETNPLAVRIEVGAVSISYTGDGELSDDLARLVSGVDLLIAESYRFDKPVRGHLSYPDLASLEPRRMVLTHMHANMLERIEGVPEECAYDGYTIELSPSESRV